MAKVRRTRGCWLWTGCLDRFGYGRFQDGTSKLAHRWVIEYLEGPLTWNQTSRATVNHKCDHRNCVRPSHLYVGTQKQNVKDALVAGTHRNLRTASECKYGHDRAKHGYRNRQGTFVCRICVSRRNREARARRNTMILLPVG